jgi:hypothetical protein
MNVGQSAKLCFLKMAKGPNEVSGMGDTAVCQVKV